MALDPARQYIDDVMERYGELFPDEAPTYKVGGLALAEHDAPPIVKWRFGGIVHEESALVDTIGTEVQELIVRIWGSGANQDASEAQARTIKNRLLLACRQVAFRTGIPAPVAFGSFDWLEEAHRHLGRALEGSIEVKLGIADQQFETVVVRQAQVTQHADYDGDGTSDETIHTTDDFPELPPESEP